jgi:HD-GYP domain-containing protein (c-di-GMP phosphodiesterase class II)
MTGENVMAPFKKIRVKASIFVLLLLVSTTLAFYMIAVRIINQRILNEVLKRGEALSQAATFPAGYSLFSDDLLGMDNLVYKIKSSNPDIEYVAVLGTDRKIHVHSDISKIGAVWDAANGKIVRKGADGTVITETEGAARNIYEVSSPIQFLGMNLGSVVLGINKSVLFDAQREAQRKIIAVFAAVLIIGVTTSVLLSSFLTRPIQELSAGVAELKEGGISRPLRVYSQDELGRLTQSFNEMTALITSQRDKLSESARELEEAYVSTVRVLAAAIDARDTYTLGHSTRVAQLSLELGRDLGLSAAELEDLEIACLFHDVGKIKLPDTILLKQGRLDVHERREMMRHTEYGGEILAKAPSLFKYIPAVRHHHEWYDGTGYPDGLTGHKIPLPAAIISLADVYDAMTSDRPYRGALSEEEAMANIDSLAGRQFDPDLAARFIRLRERTTSTEAFRTAE